LLFTAIARAREGVISDAMSDAPKIFSNPPTSSKPNRPSPAKSSSSSNSSGLPSPEQQRVTITLKDSRPFVAKPGSSKQLHPPSDDAMFALEGFDDHEMYEETDSGNGGGGVLFPQSDDEEISTDDSSYRDVSALNTAGLATSVPVTVPMFSRPKTTDGGYDGGEPHGQFTPTDVASSIKALALSVQDTGMFGDLPRPRIRTKAYGT